MPETTAPETTVPIGDRERGVLTPRADADGRIDSLTYRDLEKIRDVMRTAFAKVSDTRQADPTSYEIVDSVDALGRPTKQMRFVHVEMIAMLDAVNTVRAEGGLGSLDLADIARVEQQASGHSDYWRKYTMYCAELAAFGVRQGFRP